MCPASQVTCRRAAYRLLSEEHSSLVLFGTPSEALIPAEKWNASPRGQKAVLRVPLARSPHGYVLEIDMRAKDACLADALAKEVARYFE
jgi:hypothetical protein